MYAFSRAHRKHKNTYNEDKEVKPAHRTVKGLSYEGIGPLLGTVKHLMYVYTFVYMFMVFCIFSIHFITFYTLLYFLTHFVYMFDTFLDILNT